MFIEDFRNSCQKSNTFNSNFTFHFIKMDFYLDIIIGNSQSVTRLYTGISTIQFLVGARELSLLQNFQIRSNSQPANSSLISTSTLARLHSLTTRILLESSLKNSAAITPLNLSPSMTHSVTALFYPNHLPMSISLKKLHYFWFFKGIFLDNTYLLHAH